MQVHQPFYLGLTALGIILWLVMIGAGVHDHRAKRPDERQPRWLSWLYVVAVGLIVGSWYSRAHDLPHRESDLTGRLNWAGIAVTWLAIIINGVQRKAAGRVAGGEVAARAGEGGGAGRGDQRGRARRVHRRVVIRRRR
ncbi:MAG: hypothetical protein JO250_20275 [Armatimonadetes bacterium]|nr:hypothetical protein [Armatimonadota bacterium]